MSKGHDSTKNIRRVKAQRAASGKLLCACIAIGADDLPFVESDAEWVTIETEPIDDGLILTIRGA